MRPQQNSYDIGVNLEPPPLLYYCEDRHNRGINIETEFPLLLLIYIQRRCINGKNICTNTNGLDTSFNNLTILSRTINL